MLIQRFIAESKARRAGRSSWATVLVAAMRRKAQGDEFRSTSTAAGPTEAITLDPYFERVAVQAAQIMGLRVRPVWTG